jgi:predicted ATPase/class 3 adenylate cyclase
VSVEPDVPQAATTAVAAAQRGESALPTGTISFLFSDIEGSTRLLQELGAGWPAVLGEHDRIMDGAIAAYRGRVFGREGDAVFAAFDDAASAIHAAVRAELDLAAHHWPHGRALRVRIGVHTGEALRSGAGYVGLPLHQVARICNSANGGQVLVSEAARGLAVGRLEGGVELRDLGEYRLKDFPRAERLYEVTAPDLPTTGATPRTTPARPNNLPLQLTSFVGRAEIDAARRLLAETRLLTLSGPGGTGKTRLALQLATEVMDEFPDGTYFVPLDSVDDAELVPSAIAHTLGLELAAEPPLERLVRELRDRRTLLVLDNFEQVVGAAPAVARLLRDAPNLKVLVTSRIVLRAYGEQEFQVPPLSGEEAVRLFAERAMAANPGFRLNGNAGKVEEIVTRLDGLPLAIELAAARVRILPVDALAARLDQRLAMLTGGARDLPARQQTLRGAIDWSYDLLDEADRRLFERFSVFAAGADLPQIEAVCGPPSEIGGEVLDGLASLVEKSLLRSVPSAAGEPRFAMLATIREYAAERLAARDDESATRTRHAAVFLAIAESCAPALTGAQANAYLERLEAEHDNLRAAIDWAVDLGDAETAYRFGAALWRFWQVRGHLHEAMDRIARILEAPGAEALPAALRSRALGAAGSIAYWSADLEATTRYYRRALDAARETDDRALIAEATYNAGFEPSARGGRRQRYADGGPLFREALELYRELGDEVGIANATWAVGISILAGGDHETARRHLEDGLELYRRVGNRFGEGWALHMIGLVDIMQGRADDAEARFRDSLAIFRETNDRGANVLLLLDFALVARERGDLERFWTLAGASDALSQKTGIGLARSIEDFVDIKAPDRPDDDPDAARAWDTGVELDPEAALALALGEPAGG